MGEPDITTDRMDHRAEVGKQGMRASSSGGVLVERERGTRMSPLLLLLLALLVILAIVIYWMGYTGNPVVREVAPPPSVAPTASKPLERPDTPIEIPPSDEVPTGVQRAPLGSPVLAQDPLNQAPPIALTPAEVENRSLMMMAFNLVNQEITRLGYAAQVVSDPAGPYAETFDVPGEIAAATHAASYAEGVVPVARFASAHAALRVASDMLKDAAIRLSNGASGAEVSSLLGDARIKFDAARVVMDGALEGTY